MTLGMYVPPAILTADAEQDKENFASKSNVNDAVFRPAPNLREEKIDVSIEAENKEDYFTSVITEKAKEQMMTKLGPKIAKQIEDDFIAIIIANMEEVIQMIVAEAGNEESIYFGITEQPTKGYGEKIFNIYDYRTKEDIARFDVRRDNRPLEGYWFNFHYHLSKDNFEKHYEIGEIYWDKNIPPKWMS